jgi:hypothetical protein
VSELVDVPTSPDIPSIPKVTTLATAKAWAVGRGHMSLLTNLDTWHSEPFRHWAAAGYYGRWVIAGRIVSRWCHNESQMAAGAPISAPLILAA